VLEHGAWADASGWAGVIGLLQADGYTVYAPPDPLSGLANDSATLADFLKTITGPIILVGHSYGGMVITNAATGNPNVKALVYIDAFIPAQGDTAFGLTAAQPGSCLDSANAFAVAPYPGAPAGTTWLAVTITPAKARTAAMRMTRSLAGCALRVTFMGLPFKGLRADRERAYPRAAQVKRRMKASAVCATWAQPLSMVRACPRSGISVNSVTPGLCCCRLYSAAEMAVGTVGELRRPRRLRAYQVGGGRE
jgi:pimeloyl-ACP methyl ester carboxylesterase